MSGCEIKVIFDTKKGWRLERLGKIIKDNICNQREALNLKKYMEFK